MDRVEVGGRGEKKIIFIYFLLKIFGGEDEHWVGRWVMAEGVKKINLIFYFFIFL